MTSHMRKGTEKLAGTMSEKPNGGFRAPII